MPPPTRLLQPFKVPIKLLMGPGPSNMREGVRAALNAPLLGHLHTEFTDIMDDVKSGLQYLFQTNNSLTFAVSGTGHAGMECALMNLLERDETLLVVQNGIWGLRVADLAKRLDLQVKVLNAEVGKAASLEEFSQAIDDFKPKVAFVCHGESSTGVMHPLDGFGDVCHKNGTLLLVDTVASIGGAPFHADKLGVDCVYAATQKVLNAPPGLSPISFSEMALNKIKQRKTRVPSFYFDALELGNYWGCFDEPRRYHHTGIISLVYALREALVGIAQEGLNECVARHQQNAKILYSALDEVGLKPFVEDPALRLPCLTTIAVPPNIQPKEVIDHLMAQKIEVSGGLGPTFGKVWRIGTFGINSDRDKILEVILALDEAIKSASGLADKKTAARI
uniref:Alanine--glyoxylate aminotransferase n=1 Tax=Acrobeloides nanus TaxID=290746 RepID=A0A914CAR5_9BILA